LFDEAAVTVRARVAEDLPLVLADPVRARQVLINLLANAARHTEEGLVEVIAARDGNQIVISVRDTGVGIPPEDLPWVFEEFRQAGDPRHRRGGSGLGLAVTRHFVEMHGGNIWVESAVGVGSTFRFTLPIQQQVVSAAVPPDWSRLLGAGLPRSHLDRVVMVAEHDEPVRLFRSYLDGYQITATASLDEADDVAQDSGACALVFAEPLPPEELRRRVSAKPTLAALPVVTCPVRTAIRLGSDMEVADYLVKPVTRDALATALRRSARRVRAVLVVDDDADFRELLIRTIRQEFRRCRVLQAADGATALDIMRAESPDVVLLDLLMTGSDGYDVLAARSVDPALRAIPVVVISARGAEDETITADSLAVWRAGGLTMAEVMRCTQACLEAMLTPADSTEPAPTGALAG
jgi:CheY-like chemotaxis protein/anti-sigma regulatory factor (Ser/Thr protein kinase)